MTEITKLRRLLDAAVQKEKDTVCQSCGGKGWFEDSTYDRCGVNVSCGRCHGSGLGRIEVARIIDRAFRSHKKPVPDANN